MKRNEPVSHIMTAAPATIQVGQRPSEARRILTEGGFHHLPVLDGETLVGMISVADIMKVTYSFGQDNRGIDALLDDTHTVEKLMTPDPMSIGPRDSVRKAFELLAEGTFHALPITEGNKLVGIVTSTDLLRYTLDQY